jgi:hypothetical protein
MAANKDVNSIKLDTKLGNCNLDIQAQLREGKSDAAAEYAMQFLVWHAVGSQAFNKKSDFKRNAPYSEDLAKHVRATAMSVLGDCFDSIVVKTSKYDAPSKLEKLTKEFVSLGYSVEDAKAFAEKAIADAPKTKQEQSTEVEESD